LTRKILSTAALRGLECQTISIKCSYKESSSNGVEHVSEASFPGPGPDGEQPPPGTPARDEAVSVPAHGVPEDDWDGDAEMAAYIADLEAGRARIPEEWETSDAL
jgi:hypothetical protein